jgi:hypothetical protein
VARALLRAPLVKNAITLLGSLSLFAALGACSTTTIIEHHTGAAASPDGGDGTVDGTSDDGGVIGADAGTKDAGKKDAGGQQQAAPIEPIPEVTYNGGNVLDAPQIVTVTFDGDVQRTTLENFGSMISTTPWWDAVTNGYCDSRGKCIGHGSSIGNVHLPATAAGSSYSDTSQATTSTLKSFIDGYITNKTLPAPTANTLYMIYFPSTTMITLDGAQSCNQFGGYHNAATATSNGVTYAYAIIPRCSSDLSELTLSASHELIEAATDPFISSNPSNPYSGYGSMSSAWDVLSGGEVGDRCFSALSDPSESEYTESGFVVQRSFSNVAAKGSHDPCVPAPAPTEKPYFNVAPRGGDVINLAVGAKATIEVDAFSDAPMSPIQFGVQEVTQYAMGGGSNVLTLSADQSELAIGGKANVTVTLTSSPQSGFATFILVGQSGNTIHYWPIVVQPQ